MIEVSRMDWKAHLRTIAECMGRGVGVAVRARGVLIEDLAEVNMPEADVVELVGRSGHRVALRIVEGSREGTL